MRDIDACWHRAAQRTREERIRIWDSWDASKRQQFLDAIGPDRPSWVHELMERS